MSRGMLRPLFRTILYGVLVSIGCMVHSACSDDHKNTMINETRPSAETSYLSIPLGQSREIKIRNATEIHTASVPSFVEVTVTDNILTVFGKNVGKGVLDIRADGYLLRCTVEVIDVPDVNDDDAFPDDTAEQLSDTSVRLMYGKLVIKYDDPGNMFAVSSDHCTVIARSLHTGGRISVSSPSPFMDLADGIAPYTLVSPSLDVNGENVELTKAVVLKVSDNRIWLLCMPAHKKTCLWLVMERSVLK